jgi:hypothetical protein
LAATDSFFSIGRPMPNTTASATIRPTPLRTNGDSQADSHQLVTGGSSTAKLRAVIATTSPRSWVKPTAPRTRFSIACSSSRVSTLPPSTLRSATATDRRLTVPVWLRVTETSRPTA